MLADEYLTPEYVSPLIAAKEDTYATFRVFLENEELLDFAFDFWIAKEKKRMPQRFEKFNLVGAEIFVICKSSGTPEVSKRRTLDDLAIVFNSVDDVVEPPSFPDCKKQDGEPL